MGIILCQIFVLFGLISIGMSIYIVNGDPIELRSSDRNKLQKQLDDIAVLTKMYNHKLHAANDYDDSNINMAKLLFKPTNIADTMANDYKIETNKNIFDVIQPSTNEVILQNNQPDYSRLMKVLQGAIEIKSQAEDDIIEESRCDGDICSLEIANNAAEDEDVVKFLDNLEAELLDDGKSLQKCDHSNSGNAVRCGCADNAARCGCSKTRNVPRCGCSKNDNAGRCGCSKNDNAGRCGCSKNQNVPKCGCSRSDDERYACSTSINNEISNVDPLNKVTVHQINDNLDAIVIDTSDVGKILNAINNDNSFDASDVINTRNSQDPFDAIEDKLVPILMQKLQQQ